eukprot:jgi/Botrbrau1/5807/Bobra.0155s0029.1
MYGRVHMKVLTCKQANKELPSSTFCIESVPDMHDTCHATWQVQTDCPDAHSMECTMRSGVKTGDMGQNMQQTWEQKVTLGRRSVNGGACQRGNETRRRAWTPGLILHL